MVGGAGTPPLIDGGNVTAPSFRMIHPDGSWFQEGKGVEPDIPVWEDPSLYSRGTDPQIQKAVEVLIEELENQPVKEIKLPTYETR
jgi:tricorn protease